MPNTTLTPAVAAAVLTPVQAAFVEVVNTAILYLTEFESLSADTSAGALAPIAHCPPVAYQVVYFGATQARSAPFNHRTRIIRLHTDSTCVLQIGDSGAPVAVPGVNGVFRMAANQTEYFSVRPGAVLAVITS